MVKKHTLLKDGNKSPDADFRLNVTYNEDWTLVGIPHPICLACERKPISEVWIAGGKIFPTAAHRRLLSEKAGGNVLSCEIS